MGVEDRDWFQADRRRREKLVWNDRRGELEHDRPWSKRRFRWPYRLRTDLPLWVRRVLRQIPFWAVVVIAYVMYREYFQ
jgi:hypothetical protein